MGLNAMLHLIRRAESSLLVFATGPLAKSAERQNQLH